MNRRTFVKAGAGAFAIAATGKAYGAGAPSNRVRLAIMGCHAQGRGFSVMQSAAKIPGVEIAMVCDVDARARDAAAAKIKEIGGNTPICEKDIRKVLASKEIDGILCETPDHWHAWAAWAAMKAGKAVYVEKPCSFCAAETEILAATQRATNGIFQMGNQRRSSPMYKGAIAAIRDGAIGEPRWAKTWYMANRVGIGKGKEAAVPEWLDWELWQGPAPRRAFHDNYVHYKWHWFKNWGTGENGNNAPHFTDIGRWALGVDFPTRVTAGGGQYFYPGDDWEWPDSVNATWEFPGGKYMTWECVSCVNARPYENITTGCTVYGLKGAMFFHPGDKCVQYDAKGKMVREWTSANTETQVGSLTDPTRGLDGRHLARYVECIRQHDPNTASTAQEAEKSMLLIHSANMAHLTGETIRIDPASGKLAAGSAGGNFWAREYAPGWEMK